MYHERFKKQAYCEVKAGKTENGHLNAAEMEDPVESLKAGIHLGAWCESLSESSGSVLED